MNKTYTNQVVKEKINAFLDKGLTDKNDIIDKVMDETGLPRPTVRRIVRDLNNELIMKVRILES